MFNVACMGGLQLKKLTQFSTLKQREGGGKQQFIGNHCNFPKHA